MRRALVRISLLALLGAPLAPGCGQPETRPDPDRPVDDTNIRQDDDDRFEGDRRACSEAADCVASAAAVDGDCCLGYPATVVHNRRYEEWRERWQQTHCDDVHCEALPPEPPLQCELEVRCVEGRCRNDCD